MDCRRIVVDISNLSEKEQIYRLEKELLRGMKVALVQVWRQKRKVLKYLEQSHKTLESLSLSYLPSYVKPVWAITQSNPNRTLRLDAIVDFLAPIGCDC
jgi:hypothetical protein